MEPQKKNCWKMISFHISEAQLIGILLANILNTQLLFEIKRMEGNEKNKLN